LSALDSFRGSFGGLDEPASPFGAVLEDLPGSYQDMSRGCLGNERNKRNESPEGEGSRKKKINIFKNTKKLDSNEDIGYPKQQEEVFPLQ